MRDRPPRMIDWLTSLLLLGGMVVSAAPRAEKPVVAGPVRDLYYGEALFHFYQQDDFTALTHLLAARDAGRVSHHEAEAELLLGGLHLSYGQHDKAAQIFERLLASTPAPRVRDRAWFYLGKVRYQRGLYAEALDSFARVGNALPESLAGELPMLIAQSHMARGDYASAQQVLADWDAPGNWAGFARYNLGVALVRMNRLEEGAQLLDRVGRMDSSTAEQSNLRDKANLALGYARLQVEDAQNARPVLERVRLRGPYASKALLGAGWADAIAGDYRSALVPWLELVDRDLFDSAVQESFIAIPYALGRLDAYGAAVDRYRNALGAFDQEIERIDQAIDRAREGVLVPALLEREDAAVGRWYWQLSAIPDSSDSRYLYHLLADHEFQEGFKNYRDLDSLSRHLQDWEGKLSVFSDMVGERVEAYSGQLPATDERLQSVNVGELTKRRDDLAAEIAGAESGRDISALANATERDQLARLHTVAQDPGYPAADEALRQRHRLLNGVLQWQLDSEFKERLWRSRRALGELDAALIEANSRISSIAGARSDEPRRFDEFAVRIAGLTPRIAAMRTAIDRSLQRQEQVLVALAVRELEAQKERLASYQIQARFALATVIDRAGTQAAVPREVAR